MLEVTDKRLRARAHRRHGPGQSRRRSLGRAPSSLAAATPHHRPALLPPVGGSSSAETLTELPRSSGQGHAPSRSSDRTPLSFRLLPFVPLPLTLPASSLLLSSLHLLCPRPTIGPPSYSFRTVSSHQHISSSSLLPYTRICMRVYVCIDVYFIFDLGPSRDLYMSNRFN